MTTATADLAAIYAQTLAAVTPERLPAPPAQLVPTNLKGLTMTVTDDRADARLGNNLPAEADDAATVRYWTDRAAATVVEMTDRRLVVRLDEAIWLNPPGSGEPDAVACYPGGFAGHFSGAQRYRYRALPAAATQAFSKRADGSWTAVGEQTGSGTTCVVGVRRTYRDLNF